MPQRRVPAIVLGLVLVVAQAHVASAQAPLRKIGELELSILGISATLQNANPAVPKNTAAGIRVSILGGSGEIAAADLARLLGTDLQVRGEITGPGLTQTLALTSVGSDPLLLLLPPFAVAGDYRLSNLRIVSTVGAEHTLLDVAPARATLRVLEQILITSVRTRPLTLQEIQDKGIVLDKNDYLGFEFTLGLAFESRPVKVSFPVVFDRMGEPLPEFRNAPLPRIDGVDIDGLAPLIVPMMLNVEQIGARTLPVDLSGQVVDVKIPSVLVIPGNVGYLNQFFSAQLFVSNGAPASSTLSVRDLNAAIDLDPDRVGDPNTPALTLPPLKAGPQNSTKPVRTLGPDGTPDTADDGAALAPGIQGQSEFLVQGLLEGFHKLAFDITGTLDGLATGSVKVSGRATGGVLVRNPYFNVTFTAPAVVRAGEDFTLYATVTNIGQGLANDLSLTIDSSRLSGAELTSNPTLQVPTLRPGNAYTFKYEFQSTKTGQVNASYLKFDDPTHSGTGDLKFMLGVDERNVALSPDTLVLPAQVGALPGTVVEAAMRVLGQAWSVANSPVGTLPPGVIRITKAAATAKALALAEAGLRVTLGQAPGDAVRDLIPDFYGGTSVDPGFDQLLRNTEAGHEFARAVGAFLNGSAAAAGGLLPYERGFASIAASGPDFLSIAATGARPVVRDAAGNLTQSAVDGEGIPESQVRGAVFVPFSSSDEHYFGYIAAPTAGPYSVLLDATTGAALSLTWPADDGTFLRSTFTGIDVPAAGSGRVVIDPGRTLSATLEIDADGDGTFETQRTSSSEPMAALGPHLVSANVIGPETLSSAAPMGFHVALLFDRVVDASSGTDRARYSIPKNRFVALKRQMSGRLVFGQLEQPEGPYVPSSITANAVADLRGVAGNQEQVGLQSRLEGIGAVVTGRVFQGDGLPVSSGVIRYLNNSDNTCEGSGIPTESLAIYSLPPDGQFEFRYVRKDPCGMPFRLFTQDPITSAISTADSYVRAEGEHIVLDMALFGLGTVTGTVRDTSGSPVGGALVAIRSGTDPQIESGAITDGAGQYVVPNIPVGTVNARAQKGVTMGVAGGRIPRAGGIGVVDITVDTGSASISGTVKRREGTAFVPAVGAAVWYWSIAPTGTLSLAAGVLTDGQGRYQLDPVPAGSFKLEATLNTYAREKATIASTLAIGERLTNADLLVETAQYSSIQGTVQFANGDPVSGAGVILGERGAITDASGVFTFDQVVVRPAEPYMLMAYSADQLRKGSAFIIVDGITTPAVASITLSARGNAEFTVFDPAGVPVADQEVIVLAEESGLRGACSLGCGCSLAIGRTDAAGVVRFEGLPAGRVHARVTRSTSGFTEAAEAYATILAEGATASGVVRFAGYGSVTGHVLGPDGRDALGAEVTILSRRFNPQECAMAPGVSHRVRTGEDGTFSIPTVALGNVTVSVTHVFGERTSSIGGTGTLARPGDSLDFDLTLRDTTAGEFSGRVLLPDGTTPAGAGVEVTASGPLPDVTVFTDATGGFRFARIFPAGSYTVSLRDPLTGGMAQETVSLAAAQDLKRDFRLKGRGIVRVTVVTASGANVRAGLIRLAETAYPGRTYEALIDESNRGVATFERIFEGPVAATFSDAESRFGRAAGTVITPGATLDLKITITATGTVTGRFLMRDGVTPVPFGTVRLLVNNRVVGQTTTTGSGAPEELGRFQFQYVPVGNIRLEGLDPATARAGSAAGTLVEDGDELLLDVRAQGLGRVEGVLTSGGVPKSLGTIELTTGSTVIKTTTDANGRYAVDGVPEGRVSVKGSLEGGTLTGVADGTLSGEGTVLTLDIAVGASRRVSGRVIRKVVPAEPRPFAVMITASFRGIRTTLQTATDSEGNFTFEHVPVGLVTLTADEIGTSDRGLKVVEVADADIDDLELSLNGLGSIHGFATNSAGEPTGGTLTLSTTGDFASSISISLPPSGEYSFPEVLAGPVTVKLTAKVGAVLLYGTSDGVVEASDTVTQINVRTEDSGSISGVVRKADGSPAIGTDLVVERVSAPRLSTPAQTLSDGTFSATGIPLGTYVVRAHDARGYGDAYADGLVLSANGQALAGIELTLDDSPIAVTSIDPGDGATTVGLTTPIVVRFTDALTNQFGVTVTSGASPVSAVPTLSPDGRTITLTGTWPDSAQIAVTATTAITDIYGRHLSVPVTVRFRTIDVTPAHVDAITPADQAFGVDAASSVTVTFSEPVDRAATPESVISLTRPDGAAVNGALSWASDSVATFAPSAPLDDNVRYKVRVAGAVDLSGNVQSQIFAAEFSTVDTIAPILEFQWPPLVPLWTTNSRPSTRVWVSDAASGPVISTAALWLDDQPVNVTRGAQNFDFTPPSALSEGLHTLRASAADRAGNVATPTVQFQIDTIAPSAADVISPSPDQHISGQVSLAGTAFDATSGITKIDFFSDLKGYLTSAEAPGLAVSYDTNYLADGFHVITARAVDGAGHTGVVGPGVRVYVDNDPLAIYLTSPVNNFRTNASVTARLTVSEPVQKVEFSFGGQLVVDDTAPYETTFSVDAVTDGASPLVATAYGIGGETPSSTRTVVVDRTPPRVPNAALITADPPTGGYSPVQGAAGSVEGGTRIDISNLANGAFTTVAARGDGSFVASVLGAADDVLSITSLDDLENRSAPALVPIRRISSQPPIEGSTVVRYEGLSADRVGAAAGALVPDGAPDAVFTVDVSFGDVSRQVSWVDLTGPSSRSTRATVGAVLGIAADVGSPFLNAPDGTVSLTVTGDVKFTLIAADFGLIEEGATYTVTFVCADGSRFTGSYTIVPAADRTLVAHSARVSAASTTLAVPAGGATSTLLTVSDIRDIDGTRIPDGTRVAIAVANAASKDPSGNDIASAGGAITDGEISHNDPNFKVFTIVNGQVTATYSTTPITPEAITGAQVVVQVLAADAEANVLGHEAIATIDLNVRSANDRVLIAVASPGSIYNDGSDRRLAFTAVVRDAAGAPAADGTMVAVAHCEPQTDGSCLNAGTLYGGSSSTGGYRAYTVVGGRIGGEFSPSVTGLAPATGLTKTVRLTVVAANSSGGVTSTTPLGTAILAVTGPASAEMSASVAAIPFVVPAPHSQIRVYDVHDARANLVPDGARFLLGAGDGATNYASGTSIASAGGSIIDGDLSGTTGFRLFTLVNGQFGATYETPATASFPADSQNADVRVQLAAPTTNGVVNDRRAIAYFPLALTRASNAPVEIHPTSLIADTMVHTAALRFGPVIDSFGNVLPDGTNVLVSAGPNKAMYPGTSTYVPSVGGQITNGTALTSGYSEFTVQGGFVDVVYADQNLLQAPGTTSVARVVLVPAGSTIYPLSSSALGIGEITLAGTTSAVVTVAPAAMYHDGTDRRAVVTLTNIRDAAGQLVPDGTLIGLTADAIAGLSVSAGGDIIGGVTDYGNYHFQVFPVVNGQIVAEYSAAGVGVMSQEQVATMIAVAARPNNTVYFVDTSRVLGTATLRLLPLSGAVVQITPGGLLADGAKHSAQVVVQNLVDSSGNPVPDGTRIALTAKGAPGNVYAYYPSGVLVRSEGGVLDGIPVTPGDGQLTDSQRANLFTVAGGEVRGIYSDENIAANPAETRTARITVLPVNSATGAVTSTTGIAQGTVLLHGITSTTASGPSTVSRTGGPVVITFNGIADAAGNLVPDGTLVGATVASEYLYPSAGGTINGGTAAGYPYSGTYRVFSVQNGAVSISYDPSTAAAGGSLARLRIVGAKPNGTLITTTPLNGGVWLMTLTP